MLVKWKGPLYAPVTHRRQHIQGPSQSKQLRAVPVCATRPERFNISSITELEGWLNDSRNQKQDSLWDGLKALPKYLSASPLNGLRVMSGILKKMSPSWFSGKERWDELLNVAKLLFEVCANNADILAPDQIVELLDIYTYLIGVQHSQTKNTTTSTRSKKDAEQTAQKWADVRQYLQKTLDTALPSALGGATVQQVLACTRALNKTGLVIQTRSAFQVQLAESLALSASFERFTDTCSLQDLADVVAELMSEDGMKRLNKEAIANIKSAANRLIPKSSTSTSEPRQQRRQLKVVGRSRSPRGTSSDTEGSDEIDDDSSAGNSPPVNPELLPDHAAIVAQFFLLLPAGLAVDHVWTYAQVLNALALVKSAPKAVEDAECVVELCHMALRNHQWKDCKPSLHNMLVLRTCQAIVALSKVESSSTVFDAPTFPALLKGLVATITAPGSTLKLTKELISALVRYVQSEPAAKDTKPKGGVHFGPTQQQQDNTVSVILECLSELSTCECDASTEYGRARVDMKNVALDATKSLVTGKNRSKAASGTGAVSAGSITGIQSALKALEVAVTNNIPLQRDVQEGIEQQIIDSHYEVPSKTLMQALLNLASLGKPLLKHELMDVCLLQLKDLSSQLSPQQLSQVIAVVAAAEWADRTLMRERLLAAASNVLARCTDISQCEALVKAAGALNAITPAQKRFTRLLNVGYDAEGSILVPTPKVWASTVESLFAKPQSAFITSGGPHDIISILWSLCLQLNAQPSEEFIAAQLQPLADDSNSEMSFDACRSDDLVRLMQLIYHWKAAPAANDWLLKLVDTAEKTWSKQFITGTQMGLALECLPTLADPSLKVFKCNVPENPSHTLDALATVGVAPRQDNGSVVGDEAVARVEYKTVQGSTDTAPSVEALPVGLQRSDDIQELQQHHNDVVVDAESQLTETTIGEEPYQAAHAPLPLPPLSQHVDDNDTDTNKTGMEPTVSKEPQSTAVKPDMEADLQQCLVTGEVEMIVPGGKLALVKVAGVDAQCLLEVQDFSATPVPSGLSSVLKPGDKIKAVLMNHNAPDGHLTLSTREVEPWPGAMLTHPQTVYETAEEVWHFKQQVYTKTIRQTTAAATDEGHSVESKDTIQEHDNAGVSDVAGLLEASPPTPEIEDKLAVASMTDIQVVDAHTVANVTASSTLVSEDANVQDTPLETKDRYHEMPIDAGASITATQKQGNACLEQPASKALGEIFDPNVTQTAEPVSTAQHAAPADANRDTEIGAQTHTVWDPKVRVTVKHLASKLATKLLTTTSLKTLSKRPELLATAVNVLYVLEEQPSQGWLQDFEEVTSGYLEEIAAALPTALVRMLWSLQQLGHTPKLLWVSMVAKQAMAQFNRLATSSPAELPTLLAGLHVSLTVSEQSSSFISTQLTDKQPPSSTDAFGGTVFASENVQSLGVYHEEITRSMVEIANVWLRGFDTNRSLVTGIDSRILLVAIQALAVMQLPVDDPLYALLDKKLPVAPGYTSPPPVPIHEEGKKKPSRGKAAKQAAKAAVKVELSKSHIPNDVWVLVACTAIQNMQRNSAGALPGDVASQRGLVTALLTLQKGTGSQEPHPHVKQTIQAQLNLLIDLIGSQASAADSNSLSSDDCLTLLKACKTCSVGNPVSLTSHYFNLAVKQGFTSAAASLEQLQELQLPMQMWQVESTLLTLHQQTARTDGELQDKELGTLAALLLKLVRFQMSLSEVESEKHVEAYRNIIDVLHTYLSRAELADVINNSSTAAAAYLSCIVSCSQINVLSGKDRSPEVREAVALQCLANVTQQFPQSLLQQAVNNASKAVTAYSTVVRLHLMLLAIVLHETNNHPLPIELFGDNAGSTLWDHIKPGLLYQAYGSSDAWAPVLCHQLLKVLGIVEGPDGKVQSMRSTTPPSVEWVTQFMMMYREAPPSTSMGLRVLVLLDECGLLSLSSISTRLGATPALSPGAATSLQLFEGLMDAVTDAWQQGSVWTPAQDIRLARVILQASYVLPAYLMPLWNAGETFDWYELNIAYRPMITEPRKDQLETLQAQLSSIPPLLPAWQGEDGTKNATRWAQEMLGHLLIQSMLEDMSIQLTGELDHLAPYLYQLPVPEQAMLLTTVDGMYSCFSDSPLSVGARQAVLKLVGQPGLLSKPGGADVVRCAINIASMYTGTEIVGVQDAISDEQARSLVEDALKLKNSKERTQTSTFIATMGLAVRGLHGTEDSSLRISPGLAKKLASATLDTLNKEPNLVDRAVEALPALVFSLGLPMAILHSRDEACSYQENQMLYKTFDTLFTLLADQASSLTGRLPPEEVSSLVLIAAHIQARTWGDNRLELGGLHTASEKVLPLWGHMGPKALIQAAELLYTSTGRVTHDGLSGIMLGYLLDGNTWVEPPWINYKSDLYLREGFRVTKSTIQDGFKTWGSKIFDEQILQTMFNILVNSDELLGPGVVKTKLAKQISFAYTQGGPDIAGRYDDVWRWSLLYGMALHCCTSCSEELMQQISSRYIEACNRVIQNKPSIQAVITWLAPLITGKVSTETKVTFDIPEAVPAKSWMQQADWSSLLGSGHCPHTMMFQILSCFTTSPQFHELFKETCAEKVAELIIGEAAAHSSWLDEADELIERAKAQKALQGGVVSIEQVVKSIKESSTDVNQALGRELLNKDQSDEKVCICVRTMPAVSLLVFWQRVLQDEPPQMDGPDVADNESSKGRQQSQSHKSILKDMIGKQYLSMEFHSAPVQHLENTAWEAVLPQAKQMQLAADAVLDPNTGFNNMMRSIWGQLKGSISISRQKRSRKR